MQRLPISANSVGAGHERPAPDRDSDPPDPSAGIEFFTVTDDEKSTVSPSAEGPKGPQSGGSGQGGERMGRIGDFFLSLGWGHGRLPRGATHRARKVGCAAAVADPVDQVVELLG